MRRSIPKRKRIFIGAEGESERSLAKWLKRLCDETGLHVHLDIRVCRGGDSLAVVACSAAQYRKRSRLYEKFSAGLVLLDADRIEQDTRGGRDPHAAAGEDLSLVCLSPNLEGLLLRLHPGFENRFLPVPDTQRALRRQWPQYDKPASAEVLGRHFKLQDLQRAAQHDADILPVMETLGLPH